ncbi:hypothetical protein DSM106972_000830 [Dulcicalothrix desertica PCC 7102]|uniref:DUF4351 domain-containing protein n=1 Tax=Dulcicalothrix desertica PCC 7102 TaxID=232991 RepID=A0A3S1CS68_9CYAN|nr:DUF4351 domain-containing protein [Dulcicalothrix desertica]RUT09589.1 hypothetical protein DSM106972_000830 [Dulcicalothrix desertica PCC 7102]TWH50788.1 uncharacterized protein DUF4351 [Dulcicalothrix desertica PCC 7102]
MIDHDGLFKKLLKNFFPEFIELFFPDISNYWQRNSLQFLPQEIITDIIDGEKKIVDILVQALFQNQEKSFIIHVEHQSYTKNNFNQRNFLYYTHLYKEYRLPIYPIVIYSHDAPLTQEASSFKIDFPEWAPLKFEYRVVQLNQLDWQDFVNIRNPVACALMSKMRMGTEERPTVKLLSLQLLTSLGLNPAQIELISGFIGTYLKLNAAEEAEFQRLIATIEPRKQEEVMEIVTDWMERGIEQGMQQGMQREAVLFAQRLLNRRFGNLSTQQQERIQSLSTQKLEELGEALLDFTSIADLETWLSEC